MRINYSMAGLQLALPCVSVEHSTAPMLLVLLIAYLQSEEIEASDLSV